MSIESTVGNDPVKCPDCGTMSSIVGRDRGGRFVFCSSCGKTKYFFDFKCPVCKRINTMYEKPKVQFAYECDNCLTIVVFTEVKDRGDKFDVKWKWYSGKYKDAILGKFKALEKK